jgi:hypothetical protein
MIRSLAYSWFSCQLIGNERGSHLRAPLLPQRKLREMNGAKPYAPGFVVGIIVV